MMKILYYLKKNKLRYLAFIFPVFVLAVFFLYPGIVSASVSDTVNQIMGGIIGGIVSALGKMLIVVINVLIWVAQYNDFINAKAISNGWGILRDLCNMFFILILLVIAFATTLNRESYSMKRLLPKFIIAAILINFSKLICGVIIDFAQVIMLTFVNGFRDIGGGNLADMLGITELLSADLSNAEAVNTFAILGSYLLALLYVLVAGAVLVVMLFLLIMRIVMIWMYVVLSPLPYLMMILPATQKYADQWWKQFIEAVATGPILAFFIWLSFASATVGSSGQDVIGVAPNSSSENEKKYLESLNTSAGLTKAGSADGMLKFVISIGLLMGGIIITKQAGGAVGQMAGRLSDKIQKGGINLAKGGAKMAGRTTLDTAKMAGRGALLAGGKTMDKLGTAISNKTGGRLGSGLQSAGKFALGWQADLKSARDDAQAEKKKKRLEKLGIKSGGQAALSEWRDKSMTGKIVASGLTASPGELATMGTKATVKWMGGKLKNFAVNREKKKNLKDTERMMTDVDKQKVAERDAARTKLRNERNNKFEDYNQQEKKESEAQKNRNDKEYLNAESAGMSQPELDNLKNVHKQSMDDIAKKYNDLRNQASAQYYTDSKAKDNEIDDKYKGRATAAAEYHEVAQKTIDRDTRLKENDRLKDDDLYRIDNQRKSEIAEAKKKFSASPMARDMEIDKINQRFNAEEKKAQDDHAQRLRVIKDDYKDIPEKTELRHFGTKAVGGAGNLMNKVEPGRLTGEALKKGTKEYADAKATVQALKVEGVIRFDANDFSTAKGINGTHEKLYSELASPTSVDAKDALGNLTKHMKDIVAKGGPENKKESLVVASVKKGLAHFFSKNPEKRAPFKDLIAELEKIDTGDDKGRIKIDDFAPKTKS